MHIPHLQNWKESTSYKKQIFVAFKSSDHPSDTDTAFEFISWIFPIDL